MAFRGGRHGMHEEELMHGEAIVACGEDLSVAVSMSLQRRGERCGICTPSWHTTPLKQKLSLE